MQKLLKYEITSTSYYLVENTKQGKGCRLKKNDKASFARGLVEQLPVDCRNVQSNVDMVVVDFMAFIRKLPQKVVSSLKNYGDLAKTLMELIMGNASRSSANRIDIIFDVYRTNSIKDGERASRSTSMENKVQVQVYFMNWVVKNYRCGRDILWRCTRKPLYKTG